MEFITGFIDIFIHLDQHLNMIIQAFGAWTYLIVFVVIFCETGLVVTPLLPGDSLIFALGAIAAQGSLEIGQLMIIMIAAAIAGDSVNYTLGKFFSPRIFRQQEKTFFKKEYLDRTKLFYERHGGKTIFMARFVPIIRTFAPFVAGIGNMHYGRFSCYNVSGGIVWVVLFAGGGYYFGNMHLVRENFTLFIMAIIIISIMPGVVEFLRRRTTS